MDKPENNETKPLVRVDVIAKHFDVHKRTVALWAENGIIPCVRIGGALRFDFDAVIKSAKNTKN